TDYEIRVVKLAALVRPWGMAFSPDREVLVTERGGQLRIVRNGVLDPQPVAGTPVVYRGNFDGLLDIALHPRFAENHLVYLYYSKDDGNGGAVLALFRGRFDGKALVDGRDIFICNTPIPKSGVQGATGRIVFGRDGMLYMSVGVPYSDNL